MSTSKYIAITLGPITRIMTYAESTKSFWAASYFFSYLAKKLIKPFFNEKEKRIFLKPYMKEELWKCSEGVGMFPDQYIFKAEKGDFEKLQEHCDVIFLEIGKEIAMKLKKNEDRVTHYLKHSIKIYFLETELEDNGNVLDICMDYLNAMECQDNYVEDEPANYLAEFFEVVTTSFLTIDAFGEIGGKNIFEGEDSRLFASIIECSAGNISSKEEKIKLQKDENIDGLNLRPYQKYIAFVSGDGDGLGSALKAPGNDPEMLSRTLLTFGEFANSLIKTYGGQTIFQGGDDLFFFAPVFNKGMSVFELINTINETFNLCMQEFSSPPTFSFGVSVSYYKHPMSEAIALSESLLGKAKNEGRNRIAWNLRKHSGQSFTAVFDKGNKDLYLDCLELIKAYIPTKEEKKDEDKEEKEVERFLHSIAFWLSEHEEMLTYILKPCRVDTLKPYKPSFYKSYTVGALKPFRACKVYKLKNYIQNTFDETPHNKHRDFLQKVECFLLKAGKKEGVKSALTKLHAILRFVEFLNRKAE